MYSYGPAYMAKQKQDDQLEHAYRSYVRIWDVALKTCQRQWMIGRSVERVSGISVLAAWHDDEDDDCTRIFLLLLLYPVYLSLEYDFFVDSVLVRLKIIGSFIFDDVGLMGLVKNP